MANIIPNDAPTGNLPGILSTVGVLNLCDLFPTLRQQIVFFFPLSRKHCGRAAKDVFKHTINVHLEITT